MPKIKALNGEKYVWCHKTKSLIPFIDGYAEITAKQLEEMKAKKYVVDTSGVTPVTPKIPNNNDLPE